MTINPLTLLQLVKTGVEGAAWWKRFSDWRKERDAKKDAAKVGLIVLAALLCTGASCRNTLKDLAEYCKERPWECGAGTPPPARPTPTATATDAPRPVPRETATATATPTAADRRRLMPERKLQSARLEPVVGAPGQYVLVKVIDCVDRNAFVPQYVGAVRTAIAAYKAAHPGQFQDGGNHMLFADDWNKFYVGVVESLRRLGYEAVIDDCTDCWRRKPEEGAICDGSDPRDEICTEYFCANRICGEIVVAAGGTGLGGGFVEGYHVLTSGGDVRDPITAGGYRGRCTPKWF